MADNIKIIGNIVSSTTISRYNTSDSNLIASQAIQESFGQYADYIEYYIYNAAGNLLNTSYNYHNFKLPTTNGLKPGFQVSSSNVSSMDETQVGIISNYTQSISALPVIEIDPVSDLQNIGFSSGEFKVQYNFFNSKISSPTAELFIKEISSDRTEIRVGSTILTNEQIESGSLTLINEISGSSYFVDYLINFGNNTQATAINVALNKVDPNYEILFKLYQPLPLNITLKTTLWVVKEKITPYVFDINLDKLVIPPPPPTLRGPNFDITIPNHNSIATSYQNYTNLINNVQNISTSSYQQLLNLIQSQSLDINVDYNNFSNFGFFSSARSRLDNFYNKVKQIEDYKNNIAIYTALTSSRPNLITDLNTATASINDLVSHFDGFEYYLYFESGSSLTSSIEYSVNPYPKSNATKPYLLYSTGSSLVKSWYNFTTSSADNYDNDNQNYIVNTLPSFIKEDSNNAPYITFVNMVGHYFDNIWIFLQAVTDVNLANNNLEKGVSKDLVYSVLQSLGTKLYNQYGDSDNVSFLIGNSGSAEFSNSDTQAFTSTGSYLNTIPKKDLLAESYKRIYHNLPLLLKTKGTNYGLQTLITTFGITGSTLSVKEYGGSLKSNTLNEDNSDKIRIISNTITGSVLSPYISLQTQPTESNLFRTNDLHYVDISFSPQEYIDNYVSSSIIAISSSWNIDDIIGDPSYQYSSSYSTLNTQKQQYYSPLSASVIPFTGSAGSGSIGATDYNSFIRLIQFFDNSLFKMIKDFIPARANLSTGITISSPVLERNKWVLANPSSTSQIQENDGVISGPTIKTEYNTLYSNLTGSKAAYYTGEITGSILNVYNYFISGNINPYLVLTSSLTSAGLNEFDHSKFNVTLNNVSRSRASLTRQKLEISGSSGMLGKGSYALLTTASLQDSYEFLKTHQLSRYDGVKLFSAKYNDYTSGDISFGKTAVIDRNSVKLGLFSEVVANKFLPKRNNATLKYLVDIDGNLTELNLRNTHWPEIQNTFVSSDTASVSLFNSQLYSNQKTTNGDKPIFDSGYNYSPLLYFSSSIPDPILSFQNQGDTSAFLAVATNISSSYYISGSSINGFPLNGGFVSNIYNVETQDDGNKFTPGTLSTFPTYSVSETGYYQVGANISINLNSPISNNDVTWSLELYSGSVKLLESSQSVKLGGTATANCYSYECYAYYGGTLNWTDCDGTDQSLFMNPGTYYTIDCAREGSVYGQGFSRRALCGRHQTTGNSFYTLSLGIDKGYTNTDYLQLILNDQIYFKLKLVNATSNIFTASLSAGNLSFGSLAQSTGYQNITGSTTYFHSASIAAATSSIVFNAAISSLYNSGNYLFVPNPTTGSLNSLYNIYGDVDNVFYPKKYDLIVIYLNDNSIIEFVINDISYSVLTGLLTINTNLPLSSALKTQLTTVSTPQIKRFLLLSKIPDETNVILSFIKRDGKTSYGFLIPDDISQNVLSNIDTITKEVKQKLLNDQSVISGSL